jgi:Asp-tRNA(Asn)/Glu-tRNA(Gln) amidotransferase C subunit
MSDDITVDDVRQRAQVARLTLREDRVEMVRKLLSEALKPLRKLDSRTIRTIEPATTFDAKGAGDGGR